MIKKFLSDFWNWFYPISGKIFRGCVRYSESFLRLLENLVIICWMFFSVFIVFQACVTHPSLLCAIQDISNNWLVGLFLVFPLLYRSLRKFIDEIKEWGGMKRGMPEAQQVEPTPAGQTKEYSAESSETSFLPFQEKK